MIKKKMFIELIFLIAIIVLARLNLQNFMLYYPDSYTPSSEILAEDQLRYWPRDDAGYRGFAGTVPASAKRGTVLVFHGNAGTASDRVYYVRALAPLGFRVILAEYPGYGARKGRLGEKSFVKDGRESLKLAFEQYGRPLYLAGESLGAAVTASVLRESSVPVEGVILITPWETLLAVARGKFPWLPVRLFLRDTYDTAANIKSYQGKIAVIGAERDDIVPADHARALYESLSGKKRMWLLKGAGHNDWPEIIDRRTWEEIADFAAGE